MRYSAIATALLITATASAQSAIDNVKFTKSASPVSSTTSTGNPQYQFYHAQYTGAAWGDVNDDGHPDLFYSDRNTHISNTTIQVNLYYNNGNGTFTRGSKGRLKGTAFSSPAWIDYDGDGKLDLIVAGLDNYGYRWRDADTNLSQVAVHLYHNESIAANGFVTFTEVTDHGIRPLYKGVIGGKAHNWIAVGDYDNDGYPDVAMAGFDEAARFESADPIEAYRAVYLYHNNGDGTFSLLDKPVDGVAPFHGLTDGSVVMEDIDGDGFLDLLTTGYGASRTSEIHLYWNNGDGTFTEHADRFHSVTNASSTVADLDADGLPDIIFSGFYLNTNTKNFYLCRNLGNRQFKMMPFDQFEGCDGTQIAVGDINNDGYPDILAGGHFKNNEHTTVVYVNNGDFTFDTYGAHYDDPFNKKGHFSRVTHGAHHLVDADGDGNLDAWFAGWNNGDCSKGCTAELWLNSGADKGMAANSAPQAPTSLNASVDNANGTVTFSWAAPTDDTTPAEALRYNIFLRDTATGQLLATLPADIATGYIKTADTHGAIRRCDYTMQIPADGSYQWGVQAIDAANQGGQFATSAIEIAGVGSITADKAIVDVTAADGAIAISAPDGAVATIYTASGVTVSQLTVQQSASVSVVPGVYVVTVNTGATVTTRKVIVK